MKSLAVGAPVASQSICDLVKGLDVKSYPAAPQYRLYAYRANFHCNEARIIAKVSARRESLHLFDDLMTQLKSGQFTVPTHSF